MHVKISNIEFDVENSTSGLDEAFERIDAAMDDFRVYLSCLIVDGAEVDDNFREYLLERLSDIHEVEVYFLTSDQYLHKVMNLMSTFLEKAVPAMKEVAHEFYGHHDSSTWERFNTVVEVLNQIVQTIQGLIANPDFRGKVDRFAELGENIVAELTRLNDALVSNDMILAADLLLYELSPFAENLNTALQELFRSERHDIH
jgi:hypothetical protein